MCCREAAFGCSEPQAAWDASQDSGLRSPERREKETNVAHSRWRAVLAWWKSSLCSLPKTGDLPQDSLLFSFLVLFLCSYFRAYGKKRLIIKREILPIYPGILSCSAPALPHFPLAVLPAQAEQGWIALLPGAVQACRYLLLQYWPGLLSSARHCTVNYLQVSGEPSPVCKGLSSAGLTLPVWTPTPEEDEVLVLHTIPKGAEELQKLKSALKVSQWSPHFSGRQAGNWKPNWEQSQAPQPKPGRNWSKEENFKAPQSPAHQLFSWRFCQVSSVGVKPFRANKLQAAALLPYLLFPTGQVEGNTLWRRETQAWAALLSVPTPTHLSNSTPREEVVWSCHIAWILQKDGNTGLNIKAWEYIKVE